MTAKPASKILFFSFLFLFFFIPVSIYSQNNSQLNKQDYIQRISNTCGVTAIINPGNDSIITSNTIVYFTSASINATSYKFILDNVDYPYNTPINIGFAVGINEIKLVAYNGNCTDTAVCYYFYPGTFPPDTANTKMYYGIPAVNQYLDDFISLSSGGYLIAGDRNNNSYLNLPARGFLIKTKESGCIDWSRMFDSPYLSGLNKIAEAADGNIFVTGTTGYNYPFILKMDLSGNLVWSKKITNNSGSFFYPYGLKAMPDGGLLLTGAVGGNTHLVVIRMNNTGNIIWQKEYDDPTQNITGIENILLKNNSIYIGGVYAYSGNGNDLPSMVMKLDFNTGQTIWSKIYTSPLGDLYMEDMHDVDTLIMVNTRTSGTEVQGAYAITSLINLDTIGNIVNANLISETNKYYQGRSQLIILPGKNYYVVSAGTEPLPLQPYISYQTKLVKLDSAYNILWGRHYAIINHGQYFLAAPGPNKSLVMAGNEGGQGYNYYSSSSDKIMVKKIDSAGTYNINCDFSDQPMTVSPLTINQQPFTWTTDITPSNIASDFPISIFPFYPELRYKCPDYVDSCSFLKVTGPGSICNLNNTYIYKAHKRKSCGQPIQWDIPSGVSTIQQTDTTIEVRFASFGSYIIAAELPFGCSPLKDSVNVLVASTTPPLNLGPDTTLCPNNTLILHAGPSFMNYLWQDGTTDSLFSVTSPGQYWVDVTDSCENVLRDTVTVSLSPPVPLSIGSDRIKCNNDTLNLNAPPGFLNYSWSPNYNINSINSQNVVVNPFVDTIYTLMAEKIPGCFGFDTIHITVFHSPPINLGIDTSFCLGDSTVLNAGNGFDQYLWSNGKTSQQVSVFAVGNYSIIGTTVEGCKSYDTLRVLTVYPLPLVSLNPDPTLCIGDTRTLNAGPGFSSYLWNNGSTAQTLNVNNTGIYSVSVTDQHGCKGTDTVQISTILPLPDGFLPQDTAICSYGTLQLKTTTSFNQYLWSNGNITPSITITQPGLYWLQVTDKNNCVGKDSIVVNPKQCLEGFFVPSAFTPNNDGKNDTFKPLLFGNIKQYKFTIYNRWGEIVFSSVTPGQGWNGEHNSKQQDTNVFVWTCIYQLEGEEIKSAKGTVLLIR